MMHVVADPSNGLFSPPLRQSDLRTVHDLFRSPSSCLVPDGLDKPWGAVALSMSMFRSDAFRRPSDPNAAVSEAPLWEVNGRGLSCLSRQVTSIDDFPCCYSLHRQLCQSATLSTRTFWPRWKCT